MLQIKRIYDPSREEDGYRVLVDRLWPRGLSKEKAHLDLWLKEIAPTDTLRNWFHNENGNWEEFKKRYIEELHINPTMEELKRIVNDHPHVTLLYGSKDSKFNQAVVLCELLKK